MQENRLIYRKVSAEVLSEEVKSAPQKKAEASRAKLAEKILPAELDADRMARTLDESDKYEALLDQFEDDDVPRTREHMVLFAKLALDNMPENTPLAAKLERYIIAAEAEELNAKNKVPESLKDDVTALYAQFERYWKRHKVTIGDSHGQVESTIDKGKKGVLSGIEGLMDYYDNQGPYMQPLIAIMVALGATWTAVSDSESAANLRGMLGTIGKTLFFGVAANEAPEVVTGEEGVDIAERKNRGGPLPEVKKFYGLRNNDEALQLIGIQHSPMQNENWRNVKRNLNSAERNLNGKKVLNMNGPKDVTPEQLYYLTGKLKQAADKYPDLITDRMTVREVMTKLAEIGQFPKYHTVLAEQVNKGIAKGKEYWEKAKDVYDEYVGQNLDKMSAWVSENMIAPIKEGYEYVTGYWGELKDKLPEMIKNLGHSYESWEAMAQADSDTELIKKALSEDKPFVDAAGKSHFAVEINAKGGPDNPTVDLKSAWEAMKQKYQFDKNEGQPPDAFKMKGAWIGSGEEKKYVLYMPGRPDEYRDYAKK